MTATGSPRKRASVSTPSLDASLGLETAGTHLGIDPTLLTCRSLARGVTHETRIVERDGVPLAVLRLAPLAHQVHPGLDVRDEGRVLRTLQADGVPRPEVLLCDPDGAALGRPGMLLRYVPGATTSTWDELRVHGGETCAEEALAILVALHRTAPAVSASGSGLDGSAQARLGAVRDLTALAGAIAPVDLLETLDALAAELPPPSAPAWVHGDFRPANLVLAGSRITAVLDWEMVGWGDPARDLGIATMRSWGVWWSDGELLERYRHAGGAQVSETALCWWRCLGFGMVAAFLAARLASGWLGGPSPDAFLPGLRRAQQEWEGLST